MYETSNKIIRKSSFFEKLIKSSDDSQIGSFEGKIPKIEKMSKNQHFWTFSKGPPLAKKSYPRMIQFQISHRFSKN